MLQRLMLLGLVCGLMVAASGCGLCHGGMSCGVPICTTGNCGPDCQPTCDAGCGGSCGQCGDPCAPCGPLSVVHKLLHPPTWKTVACGGCGNCGGCGERYWGDFHGDPPECCDPCDRCGNYTGVASDGCNDGSCGTGGHHVEQTVSGGCSTCAGGTPSLADATKAYRPTRR